MARQTQMLFVGLAMLQAFTANSSKPTFGLTQTPTLLHKPSTPMDDSLFPLRRVRRFKWYNKNQEQKVYLEEEKKQLVDEWMAKVKAQLKKKPWPKWRQRFMQWDKRAKSLAKFKELLQQTKIALEEDATSAQANFLWKKSLAASKKLSRWWLSHMYVGVPALFAASFVGYRLYPHQIRPPAEIHPFIPVIPATSSTATPPPTDHTWLWIFVSLAAIMIVVLIIVGLLFLRIILAGGVDDTDSSNSKQTVNANNQVSPILQKK